jgi:hypothetical protein
VIIASGENFVRAIVSRITVWPVVVFLVFLALLTACSKPPESASTVAPATPNSTGLERIAPADHSKYPKFQNMSDWKNPYFVVRDDGIGFVDLANHEVHILTPEQIPAELVSLPSSAWPYGRVVLVTEATPKIPSDQAKAEVRKNRGLLAGTLKELDVEIRELP